MTNRDTNSFCQLLLFGFCMMLCVACDKPSKIEQYKAEKHIQDSIRLAEQIRSLAYYQSQWDSLMPQADSLIAMFKYERNEKYQDHGYYVLTGSNGLRILVRDDGKDFPVYQYGKRLTNEKVNQLSGKDKELLDRAQHLEIVIRDTKELEQRIRRTSLEIQKYQKRLEKK